MSDTIDYYLGLLISKSIYLGKISYKSYIYPESSFYKSEKQKISREIERIKYQIHKQIKLDAGDAKISNQ